MERLTQRLRTGEVLMAPEYEEKYTTEEWICMLQDRLAAYEDTDVAPENVITAADVAPVVHGRWEREPSSYWRWTPSGAVAVTRTTYRCGLCGRGTAVKSNYCPNCGAKMDGGADHAAD